MGRTLKEQYDYLQTDAMQEQLEQGKSVFGSERGLLEATAQNRSIPFMGSVADMAAKADPEYTAQEHQEMAKKQLEIVDKHFKGDVEAYKEFMTKLAQDPEHGNKDFKDLVMSGKLDDLAAEEVLVSNPGPVIDPDLDLDPEIDEDPIPNEDPIPDEDTDDVVLGDRLPNQDERKAIEGKGNEVVEPRNAPDIRVSRLQEALVEAGYEVGTYPDGSPLIDGREGKLTRSAIDKYAEKHGLDPRNMSIEEFTKHVEENSLKMSIEQAFETEPEYGMWNKPTHEQFEQLQKDNPFSVDPETGAVLIGRGMPGAGGQTHGDGSLLVRLNEETGEVEVIDITGKEDQISGVDKLEEAFYDNGMRSFTISNAPIPGLDQSFPWNLSECELHDQWIAPENNIGFKINIFEGEQGGTLQVGTQCIQDFFGVQAHGGFAVDKNAFSLQAEDLTASLQSNKID